MMALYAVPFIVLSAFAFLLCLFVPKIRPYALEASVVPLAFGFCSIAGILGIVLLADYAHVQIPLLNEPIVGTMRWAVSLLMYSAFGLAGALLSALVTKRLKKSLFGAFPGLRHFLCRAQL